MSSFHPHICRSEPETQVTGLYPGSDQDHSSQELLPLPGSESFAGTGDPSPLWLNLPCNFFLVLLPSPHDFLCTWGHVSQLLRLMCLFPLMIPSNPLFSVPHFCSTCRLLLLCSGHMFTGLYDEDMDIFGAIFCIDRGVSLETSITLGCSWSIERSQYSICLSLSTKMILFPPL